MRLKYILYTLPLVIFSYCSSTSNLSSNCKPVKVTTDFKELNLKVDGFKPAYRDKWRPAIGINAGRFKGEFAAASFKFGKKTGSYTIKLNTLSELDGESRYRISINGTRLKKTFSNPRIFGKGLKDYRPASHIWKNVLVNKGDEIRIEFSSETNKKIPEGNSTAYSRGRWTSIEFLCP